MSLFNKISIISICTLSVALAIFFVISRQNSDNNGTLSPVVSTIRKIIPYRYQKNTNNLTNKSQKVPILMYHYIREVDKNSDPTGWSLSVTPDNFASQMNYLKNHNYQTLTFEDIDYMIKNKQSFPKNPIIISFDDGYDDFFTNAFSVLQKNDFNAVVFMIGGRVNQPGYLSSDQIKSLDDYGIEFGLHTQTHINMANSSLSNVEKELQENTIALQKITGKIPNILAYPSGQFDEDLIDYLKVSKNIKFGLTTVEQTADFSLHNPLILPRLRVSGSTTLEKLQELLNNTNSYLIVPTTTTTVDGISNN